MPRFESGRFIESFVAALLGDVAFDRLKNGRKTRYASFADSARAILEPVTGRLAMDSLELTDVRRNFEIALGLVAKTEGVTGEILQNYLTRIGAFEPGNRLRYIRSMMHASESGVDAAASAAAMARHALMSDEEWGALVSALVYDEEPVSARLSKNLGFIKNLGAIVDTQFEAIQRKDAKMHWLRRLMRW